jgi:hypothetical protein
MKKRIHEYLDEFIKHHCQQYRLLCHLAENCIHDHEVYKQDLSLQINNAVLLQKVLLAYLPLNFSNRAMPNNLKGYPHT